MIGLGYRRALAGWLEKNPEAVDCLEITAEHFFGIDEHLLRALAARYPISVHGLGLSLGTAGPLDEERLRQFARVAELANARWISEHAAFTRTAEADLGHLNPLRPTREAAFTLAQHARELSERCGKPLLLENITSHIRLEGDFSEPAFLNEVCERSGCGLLLDVTNLYINSRNHRFDPARWLDELDTRHIRQLHIVGYAERHGRLMDDHDAAVQPELLQLAAFVCARAPVEAVILERDASFPTGDDLKRELEQLAALLEPQ